MKAPVLIYNNPMIPEKLPHEYVQDLERAVDYLKSEGCKEIYLFGSLADGSFDLSSDIDLAVRGIDPARYKCVKNEIAGYVSSHEITTFSYFLEKEKYEKKKRNKIISNLLNNLSVLTAHEEILRKALFSDLEDYEDALIDELALNEEIDYIVTRNLKNFKKSRNKNYSAREILDLL